MKLLIKIFVLSLITSCTSHQKKEEEGVSGSQQNVIDPEDERNGFDNSEDYVDEWDESMPAAPYFRVEAIHNAHYLEDGSFVLEVDVKNVYVHKFSSFGLRVVTYVKLKDRSEHCEMVSHLDDDTKGHKINDWEAGEVKRLKVNTPSFDSHGNFCRFVDGYLSSFDRTPEEIYVELSAKAISIEDEPNGVFARYDLLDLWRSKQKELIDKGVI